jgi:glycosyltransferase involved in cell wall biosynthesis
VRARVLVLSTEPVGERMAAPAIRALELARALAADHAVTVAAPAPSEPPGDGVELLEAGGADFERLLAAARQHDVVVLQEIGPTLLSRIARLPVRLVADLYNPIVVEVLEAVVEKSPRAQRRIQRLIAGRTAAQLAAADFVICASERQRDLWLGGMALAGLISLDDYRRDPSLRSLIDVVPFGIPEEAPQAATRTFPGVPEDAPVMLWAGGIWSWLDPITPIRAAGLLSERAGSRPRLVFLGSDRPGIERTGQEPFAERARAEAHRLGLEGESVHFLPGWMPYAERGGALAAADVGVSAHGDHLEARFAYRARVIDYLWAGLPVVTTRGDTLADLVEREGLGRTVAPGDAEGFAAACAVLLEPAAAAAARKRIAAARPSLTWRRAAAPLAAWCAEPLPPRIKSRGALRRAELRLYRESLIDTATERGGRDALARMLRRLRRTGVR